MRGRVAFATLLASSGLLRLGDGRAAHLPLGLLLTLSAALLALRWRRAASA